MAIFGKDELNRGKQGEEMARDFFEKAGYHVRDVRDDDDYRDVDVDFLVYKWGEPTRKVEVKSSSTACSTGKVVVEDMLNVNKNKIGWLWYTEADFITVVSKDKMFMYKPAEMREYITRVKEEYKKMEVDMNDIFNTTNVQPVDFRYMADYRYLEETTSVFKNSLSLIYYVDFHKYASLGYYAKEIDL